MTTAEHSGLKLRDDLSLATLDDEGLLLDVAGKCYYSLNETGAFIAQSLKGKGLSSQQVSRLVVEEFEVAEATARADVDAFLGRLADWGLTTAGEDGQAPHRSAARKKAYQRPAIQLGTEIRTTIAQASAAPALVPAAEFSQSVSF
jgi:hypothetical protein